jgi:hypothetical protein
MIPFDHAASVGILSGYYTVSKFGRNAIITSASVEESVWDAPDLPSTAAGPLRCFTNITDTASPIYISSDDEADAGTTVLVEWLDATWAANETIVTLGADNTETGTEFALIGTALRVNRAYAVSAAIAGNIYIHIDSVDGATKDGEPDTPATDIIAVITAGENQTLQACYTVPLGFNALMTSKCMSNTGVGGSDVITYRERKQTDNGPSKTQELLGLGDDLSVCPDIHPPKTYAEKTDIEITGAALTQAATATFGLILIPNDLDIM